MWEQKQCTPETTDEQRFEGIQWETSGPGFVAAGAEVVLDFEYSIDPHQSKVCRRAQQKKGPPATPRHSRSPCPYASPPVGPSVARGQQHR